ncbi:MULTISPECIES: NGG1p interacting factor NIF3 [unclassified Oceanobacter]|jgi:hypothetical protein|uniref:NGG1p interacting factor NIF3 n=1 Tax=unclassified Oceanobacter TaxID=2620260 RepID=UPI0026E19E5D|nr:MULTISPECIES: NGG1p interacting factor NIF3 [unclassified Oceanobacter]MDO6683537.1 NGG1p interacting factor NIF3 [Oceanobacter sp. 5_MG-2023]MDP2504772.1 NGG1p interacting factor NIF3 [Oceanobacter sp. 3_MG-2023]MDP2546215.1 NGG1p interacting factor NIF3 [Oceanobacter sp. 4_MG-2023]
MYKVGFYVPVSHLASVKQAVFAAGGGQLGEYSQCCWQVLGTGQFCPSTAANPYLGQSGQLTRVDEYRVELVSADDSVRAVLAALRLAHPYEEPAFDLVRLVDESELP